ncbi:MAG: Stp1/IreP family PP2C-type Ser/Thr phosphatase [Anaerolineae bacterium]|nr:Stp1/IreP family PP2C-type Ser/Thr phosphatase [Anaerolineae bacterium]
MRIRTAAKTHPGMVRELNEDAIFSQSITTTDGTPLALLVVCDGMGGHLGGELASRWAIESIKSEFKDLFSLPDSHRTVQLSDAEIHAALNPDQPHPTALLPASELFQRIDRAVKKANQVVYTYAQRKPAEAADAGTTLTLALVSDDLALIANVGDSRTYLVRDGKLIQLTQDHSLVASLVAAGQIKPGDIYSHPQRNIIFRSLGSKNEVSADISEQPLQPGDTLMLCSDGLWEMIPNNRHILKIIQHAASLEQACEKLIQAANAGGGDDNISVILASFD